MGERLDTYSRESVKAELFDLVTECRGGAYTYERKKRATEVTRLRSENWVGRHSHIS